MSIKPSWRSTAGGYGILQTDLGHAMDQKDLLVLAVPSILPEVLLMP